MAKYQISTRYLIKKENNEVTSKNIFDGVNKKLIGLYSVNYSLKNAICKYLNIISIDNSIYDVLTMCLKKELYGLANEIIINENVYNRPKLLQIVFGKFKYLKRYDELFDFFSNFDLDNIRITHSPEDYLNLLKSKNFLYVGYNDSDYLKHKDNNFRLYFELCLKDYKKAQNILNNMALKCITGPIGPSTRTYIYQKSVYKRYEDKKYDDKKEDDKKELLNKDKLKEEIKELLNKDKLKEEIKVMKEQIEILEEFFEVKNKLELLINNYTK